MINYGKQAIDEKDIRAVVAALRSNYLTTGPKVLEFEKKFARDVGAKYAVAVSSGTAALHVACLSVGLRKGDELITSPMTFPASSNCALYCGAKPIFADIKENGLIDESLIEKKITDKTKVILPVHYAGFPCEMKKIKEIAKKNNLFVIEDACHALGAEYNKTKIGDCAYSDMAVFSFHPVKHVTTGEGGMITTNSREIYQKLLVLRNHGITKNKREFLEKKEGPWFYEMQELGFNYRITDFQCTLGISQLKKSNSFLKKRKKIANKYNLAFSNIDGIKILKEPQNAKSAYHLYVVRVKNKAIRFKLFNYLKDNGILCQVHYIPVYWHPYYQKLRYEKGICPEAEEFYDKIISLPIYPGLKKKEQEEVIKIIKNFYAR